jgi:hypothetical protein
MLLIHSLKLIVTVCSVTMFNLNLHRSLDAKNTDSDNLNMDILTNIYYMIVEYCCLDMELILPIYHVI